MNQLGYPPGAPKVAVICALDGRAVREFRVTDATGVVVFGPAPAEEAGAFGPCAATYRLDFTRLTAEGRYRIHAGAATSPPVRIARDAFDGAHR